MSTLTKPRPRAMPPPSTERQRLDRQAQTGDAPDIKRIVTTTKRKATRILNEEGVHRSTQVQRAQRVYAEGFHEIAKAVTGKE